MEDLGRNIQPKLEDAIKVTDFKTPSNGDGCQTLKTDENIPPKIENTRETANFKIPTISDSPQEQKYFTLKIYKAKSIRIYKPLVYLKLALFLWFAGATSARTFFTVLLKQRGLSIPEISLIFILIPIVQILCTSLLSILADKIGRSKPILFGNILFTAAAALVLNLIPYALRNDFQTLALTIECMEFNMTLAKEGCWLEDKTIQLKSCDIFCLGRVKNFQRHLENINCNILFKQYGIQNNSSNILFNASQHLNDTCIYGISNFSLSNDFLSACHESQASLCHASCITNNFISSNHKSWVYVIISLLFFVSFLNVFRFFDITVMAMVKNHGADYGVHRFFSVFGNLVGPPLSGHIVASTTPEGGEYFYEAAFYAYVVFCVLTALVVLKVDVRGAEPGKHMWKKSVVLMKNPDAMFAGNVLVVLGMTWGFTSIFKYWYLEDLSAESSDFGTIEVIHSLIGLPTYLASSWLIGKIGITNVFVLSLSSQVIFCYGYSFLQAVWPAYILELTVALSFHLLWVAVMYFCKSISPPGLNATVTALAGSIHFSLGRVLGSVIGGTIMDKYGGRSAFMVLGSVNIAMSVIYGVFLLIRKKYRMKN